MAQDDFKNCPVCHSIIKAKAVFCANCKTLLRSTGASKKINPAIRPVSQIPFTSRLTYTKSGNSAVLKQNRTLEINTNDLYALIQKIYQRAASLDSGEKIEAIISSFADEYAARVAGKVSKSASERDYLIEEKRLEVWMEKQNWCKLNDSSKTLLVSAGLLYNNLLSLPVSTDFCGICLLALRALEEEAFRRFYVNYIAFLEKLYPGEKNKKYWPAPLLNRYDHKKSTKKYSLIGVTYVTCYAVSGSSSARQNEINSERLQEYAEDKIFAPGTARATIKNTLFSWGQKIDQICKDYRNPSSVNYRGGNIKAEEGLEFLELVEATLKIMLSQCIA